jgi:CRP-like cAMP-binding protein
MATALRIAREEFSTFNSSSSDTTPKANSLGEQLRALHATSTRQHFGRNEEIFAEGHSADHIYVIVSGTARLCRHTANGRRHISDFAMVGDLIGFVERTLQPNTAEAVTPVTVTTYRRSSLEQLAGANPMVRSGICSLLAANLFTAQRQLCILGCQNARERLASFLLHLAERMQTQGGELLNLPMGRLDIADHLGLTIETVCRTIAALKADRVLLVPTAHQLILSNVAALRALAQDI